MGAATKRCFVGMRIDVAARDALITLQRQLRRLPADAAQKLKPVAADNFHVTLKFLGDTPQEKLAALQDALAATAAAAGAGALSPPTLRGISAFPSVSRPRAIFAAIDVGRNAITALADAVETACASLGFPVEKRLRVPHVTLVRVRRARPQGPLTTFIYDHAHAPLGGIDPAHLVLFESQLRPQGSLYTPLCVFALGGRTE